VKQRDYIRLISREAGGLLAAAARCSLRVASWFYGAAVLLRLGAYRVGLLKRRSANVPVICVGNLTTGGTGKTPAVAYVVRVLQELGYKPCILSRGYRSDGGGNDELRVLSELCPGVPHIQNPDRVAGANEAEARGANVIVLDDGFSHLRLKRDLDILLFDALNPFGYGWLLPRGLMREPLRSVRRARFAIFSRADVAKPERLRDLEDSIRCKGFTGGVAHAAHKPVKLVEVATGHEIPLEVLDGNTVAAFCGIGNPRGFQRTLEALGANISGLGVLQLNDHQPMNQALIDAQIEPYLRAARDEGAQLAVCTQKDAVKLRNLKPELALPLHELQVEFTIMNGEEALRDALAVAAQREAQ
jgi:tetraacyldisaccharide 4'-kinase